MTEAARSPERDRSLAPWSVPDHAHSAAQELERYRSVTQGAPGLIFELSLASGELTWVSENVTRLIGLPPDRCVGPVAHWTRFIHADDRPRVEEARRKARRTGRFDVEYRLRHAADEQYRWFRSVGTVDQEHAGVVRGLAIDVTHEKRVRERERTYADLLFALTRSLDGDEVLLHVAEAARRLLRADRAVVFVPASDGNGLRNAAQSGTVVVPMLDVPLCRESSLVARCFLDGQVQRVLDYALMDSPYSVRLRPNEAGPVAAVPVHVDGRPTAVLAVSRTPGRRPFDDRDLEDAGHLAAQAGVALANARLYAQARAASDAKSVFLSTMSHELRTPLNALEGFLSLLDMEVAGPLTERQREYVARCRRSGKHLLRIVEDLLDLSRIERGRLTVRRTSFEAAEPVREAMEIVRPQLTRPAASLRGDERATGVYVLGDVGRVLQVLINLLTNAIKFTEWGEIRVTLEIDAEAVRYVVTDPGPGIEPEQLGRIFEPFYQVDGALTRASQGAGLGLAVSRSLARAMGGDLTVTSRPGEGSAFTLTLRRSESGGEESTP